MQVYVYVDVLICINFVVNYFLLLIACRILGRSQKRPRLILSAVIGSAFSLSIFAPPLSAPASALFKLFVSAVMVFVANKFFDIKQFLKEWFVFFTVSFLFGGIMLAVSVGIDPASMFYYNGIVYFNITVPAIIGFTALSYILTSAFNRFYRTLTVASGDYEVTVIFDGKQKNFTGRVDTGNMLKEFFSDTPVAVCRINDAQELLPQDMRAMLEAGCGVEDFYAGLTDSPLKGKFRLIPFNDVSGRGLLPAFRVDRLILKRNAEVSTVEEAFLAVTKQQVGAGGGYNLLLSPQMAEIKMDKVGKV